MIMLGATIEGPLAWGVGVGGFFVILGVLMTVYRLVLGPTLADRVVALDLLSVLLMALLVMFAIAVQIAGYLDVALALSLVSFLATVAFARYIERVDATDHNGVSGQAQPASATASDAAAGEARDG
ncbi:MAG: monovalent cation/H+ antiporter complex subunit F [Pseudomonadota bacterium]